MRSLNLPVPVLSQVTWPHQEPLCTFYPKNSTASIVDWSLSNANRPRWVSSSLVLRRRPGVRYIPRSPPTRLAPYLSRSLYFQQRPARKSLIANDLFYPKSSRERSRRQRLGWMNRSMERSIDLGACTQPKVSRARRGGNRGVSKTFRSIEQRDWAVVQRSQAAQPVQPAPPSWSERVALWAVKAARRQT
ncbi:hypothetical protein ElyMa_005626500 [Elysia marginata]|uniref:Uncharacterized protein n=1 Tax=Elysia marginata TaxID=1093978 RepID=A0AAV4F7D6_9GAST|nr:hypothetical protein ElyMa_005626500 [Elysia marginata]